MSNQHPKRESMSIEEATAIMKMLERLGGSLRWDSGRRTAQPRTHEVDSEF
jgi:hypothetical protein